MHSKKINHFVIHCIQAGEKHILMGKIFLSLNSSKITYGRLHTNFTVIVEISSSSTFLFPVPVLPVYEYEVMNTVFLSSPPLSSPHGKSLKLFLVHFNFNI